MIILIAINSDGYSVTNGIIITNKFTLIIIFVLLYDILLAAGQQIRLPN